MKYYFLHEYAKLSAKVVPINTSKPHSKTTLIFFKSVFYYKIDHLYQNRSYCISRSNSVKALIEKLKVQTLNQKYDYFNYSIDGSSIWIKGPQLTDRAYLNATNTEAY